MSEKTIFALSTPIGGAIAIMRISGSMTLSVLQKIYTGKIAHSRITHGRLMFDSETLDDIMAVFFAAPSSYTGEDMAELYIHGSLSVAQSVAQLLLHMELSPAQAGEFTKRAFMNGKLDLSQAEAVADIINSTASRSTSSALRQLFGELSMQIDEIETELVGLLAFIGAKIDYPDEMEDESENIAVKLANITNTLTHLIDCGMRSRSIREGFAIAIVGRPNVGKSSLLNRLLFEDKAIVSDVPGTTRDIIESSTQFCALPVRLFDTAGLHESSDFVECLGMQKTRDMLNKADLLYVLIDGSVQLCDADYSLLSETESYRRIIIKTKSDLPQADISFNTNNGDVFSVSTKTGDGIDELVKFTAGLIAPDDESGVITNSRHIDALQRAKNSLVSAANANDLDCMSTDITDALFALGEITGSHATEAVISRIFEKFCVGK